MTRIKGFIQVCTGVGLLVAATPSFAGVTTQVGYGFTRPVACASAKRSGAIAALRRGEVTGYSECQCEDSGVNTQQRWSCNVDAFYRDRD
ncbi:hypothetical protein EWE75_18935 [Sphingomonas populi]|uniref:Uncharacterized protein n=1 Tax=Sphingomonas populi TaxID=2484750 RepID=A0A4V2DCF0_9SPHN|nr:hypothetical protein [Sphingomonas populi]RZF61258.1 hypothetical protein EWE75_18935 [Sphingomonas populi]